MVWAARERLEGVKGMEAMRRFAARVLRADFVVGVFGVMVMPSSEGVESSSLAGLEVVLDFSRPSTSIFVQAMTFMGGVGDGAGDGGMEVRCGASRTQIPRFRMPMSMLRIGPVTSSTFELDTLWVMRFWTSTFGPVVVKPRSRAVCWSCIALRDWRYLEEAMANERSC